MTVETRWGSPGSAPDDPTDVEPGNRLTAGDELGEEEAPPVDAHLIHVRPTARQTLAGIAQGGQAPAWWTDPGVAREMAARGVRAADALVVHLVAQSPRLAARSAWWSLRGLAVAVKHVVMWLYDADMHPSFGPIQASDEKMALRMAATRREHLRFRWAALVALAVALAVLLAWAWAASVLVFAGVILACVAVLARLGRPEDATMLSPVVQRHVQPRLTTQNIVRALGALGIAPLSKALEKGDTSRLWRSSIAVVPGGYKVWIQLPYGTVAEQLVEHEQRLAAALGRPEDCVIVAPKPQVTPGDLDLWVFDRPQLTADLGPGPLATARKASWWDPVVIGKTRLGQPHREHLRGGAWFVGGRPSSGKSSLCRIAAAQTALDPHAILCVVNLKGSPDYVALRPVCHRYIAGSPETDPTVLERTRDLLSWVLAECARRNDYLVSLVERGAAESADVTPDLAAKHESLRPMTVILDEIHRLFDASDNPSAKEDAELLAKVIKAVRSAGITLVCATQLAGTESIPPAITRAARVRGCLVVGDEVSFRQIYGNAGPGAFRAAGVSKFRPGTVLLASLEGSPLKVGCHNITPAVLATIGKRALEARERLHLLTGEAAGEAVEVAEREDPAVLLRDLLVNLEAADPCRTAQDKAVAWLHSLEAIVDDSRAPGWLAPELEARRVTTYRLNRKGSQYEGGQLTRPAVSKAALLKALQRIEDLLEESDTPLLPVRDGRLRSV